MPTPLDQVRAAILHSTHPPGTPSRQKDTVRPCYCTHCTYLPLIFSNGPMLHNNTNLIWNINHHSDEHLATIKPEVMTYIYWANQHPAKGCLNGCLIPIVDGKGLGLQWHLSRFWQMSKWTWQWPSGLKKLTPTWCVTNLARCHSLLY